MTKEEYAEIRDTFARLAREIEDVMDWAFDTGQSPPEDVDMGDWLDKYGYYMTGDEWYGLMRAKHVMESLAGRNAARAL